MLKIWHVGGEDVYMRIPLLLKLREAGFAVSAVGNAGAEKFHSAGIPFHYYPLSRWVNPISDIRSIRSLRSLINRHRPDIVHGFDTKPSLFVSLARSKQNTAKVVRTINGMGYIFSENNWKTQLLKPAYRQAQKYVSVKSDMIIFQNSDDLGYFSKNSLVSKNQAQLIRGSGFDEDQFAGKINNIGIQSLKQELGLTGSIIVTMISRLIVNKGVLEFLSAARLIRNEFPHVQFLLVGPLSSEGSQAVDKELLDQYKDDVVLTGPRSDIPAILAASDLFVLPSFYREGLPRVLLEAAASGIPCITTDMPGCRDVISDGNNGILVKIKDVPSLVAAIKTITQSLDSWKNRAEKNRQQIVSTYGLSSVAHQHIELYRQLTEQ